eukprot:5651180-Amphidinium_carterae.2
MESNTRSGMESNHFVLSIQFESPSDQHQCPWSIRWAAIPPRSMYRFTDQHQGANQDSSYTLVPTSATSKYWCGSTDDVDWKRLVADIGGPTQGWSNTAAQSQGASFLDLFQEQAARDVDPAMWMLPPGLWIGAIVLINRSVLNGVAPPVPVAPIAGVPNDLLAGDARI